MTGIVQASHFDSQHGKTPGSIFFLYEWLTCVVLYWTKGKGNKHLERGIVLCILLADS